MSFDGLSTGIPKMYIVYGRFCLKKTDFEVYDSGIEILKCRADAIAFICVALVPSRCFGCYLLVVVHMHIHLGHAHSHQISESCVVA